MTKLDRRASRPAARYLRLLAALMMALGLSLGGLSAPALAEPTGTATDAATPARSGIDQVTDTSVANMSAKRAQESSTAGIAPRESTNGAVCESDQDPLVDGCVVPCIDGLPTGCTTGEDQCPDGDADPEQDGCQPEQECPQPDVDPNQDGCQTLPVDDCLGKDYNGDKSGCGKAHKPPKPPKAPRPHGPSGTTGGGHQASQSHASSIGTSTGTAEGTVPGSSSPASSVTSCDPTICSSTGVVSDPAPAPATTSETGSAGRGTLGNTGAPADSTPLLLLGLGLLGGGFLLVRRPRAAAVAAGAHRRDRD